MGIIVVDSGMRPGGLHGGARPRVSASTADHISGRVTTQLSIVSTCTSPFLDMDCCILTATYLKPLSVPTSLLPCAYLGSVRLLRLSSHHCSEVASIPLSSPVMLSTSSGYKTAI